MLAGRFPAKLFLGRKFPELAEVECTYLTATLGLHGSFAKS